MVGQSLVVRPHPVTQETLVLGLVAPEDLLSACCLVLPAALVCSCLLSSFPLLPGPRGAPGLLLGLSWSSPGRLLDLSWVSLGGPIFLALQGLSRAAPGPSWGALGVLLGCSWRLLDLCWASPGELWGLFWDLLEKRLCTEPCKKHCLFSIVGGVFGPPGSLLGAS